MGDSRVFSKNLKHERDVCNLSQQALADLAGVSLQTIFRAESKGVVPRAENLEKIASALKTTIANLFTSYEAKEKAAFLMKQDEENRGKVTLNASQLEELASKIVEKNLAHIKNEPIAVTQKINHGTIENLKLQIETLTKDYNEQKRQIKKLEKQLPTKKQRDLLGRIESAQPIRQKIIEAVIYNNPALIRSMSPDVIQAFQLLSKAR